MTLQHSEHTAPHRLQTQAEGIVKPVALVNWTLRALLQDDVVPEGEVLLSHENKSPIQESFQFQRITGGITRLGSVVSDQRC